MAQLAAISAVVLVSVFCVSQAAVNNASTTPVPASSAPTTPVPATRAPTTGVTCFHCISKNVEQLYLAPFGLSSLPEVDENCLEPTFETMQKQCSSQCYELYLEYKNGTEKAVVRGCEADMLKDALPKDSCESGPVSLENIIPEKNGQIQQSVCSTDRCNKHSSMLKECNKPKVGQCYQCMEFGNSSVDCSNARDTCFGAYCVDILTQSGDKQQEMARIKGCISVNPQKNGTGCYVDGKGGKTCYEPASDSLPTSAPTAPTAVPTAGVTCFHCITKNVLEQLYLAPLGLSNLPKVDDSCLEPTFETMQKQCSSHCYELYLEYKNGTEKAVVRGCEADMLKDALPKDSCESGPVSLENIIPEKNGLIQQTVCSADRCNKHNSMLKECDRPKVGKCQQCVEFGNSSSVDCKSTAETCYGAYCADVLASAGDSSHPEQMVRIKGCISVNPHKNGTGCYADGKDGKSCWTPSSASITTLSSGLFIILMSLGFLGKSF